MDEEQILKEDLKMLKMKLLKISNNHSIAGFNEIQIRRLLTPKELKLFYLVYERNYPNNLKTDYTFEDPYYILNIEKREYSKEELLAIIGNIINKIKQYNISASSKKKKIDLTLDAYNKIVADKKKK